MGALLQSARKAFEAVKVRFPDPAVMEELSSISPISHEIVVELTHAKLRRDETLVRRMLAHWISEVAEPVMVMDRDFNVVGLGPAGEVGETARIFIHAADFEDDLP